LRFFTAARGHHADIGGVTPGSMPPDSKTIHDEGVVFDGQRILRGGALDEAGLRATLGSGPFPARDPDRNLADIKAQIASCAKSAAEMRALCADWGAEIVSAYMGHVLDDAEERTREVIGKLSDGAFRHEMDDGAVIAVAIRVDHATRSAVIDFTGTSPQRPNNFNAPRPVTQAAVLYAFRCLVDSEIPLNAGCMRPLTIIAPEGSMLNPVSPAAVVAGNVETSQAVTDTIFAAMGVMAAAQGTMNNLTFGNERYQYYETICGGAGAGPDWNGASAVHTHMTNSRLTDPEVLEWRFPVLLRRFEVRAGSGGDGASGGGDGVVREIEFREPMDVSILSTRRRTAPFGLAGGGAGALGRNTIRRTNASVEILDGCARVAVSPGDAIVIETPGGGGYGQKER
jgi:5-oxoprolinase (ATP-hydrolysing)